MTIFPKSISEEVSNEHLSDYSKTLVSYIAEIQVIIPFEYHQLIPSQVYLCPLCLKNYFVKTNSGTIGNSEFSLDHLPPKKAGGSYKIITCKKCNNDAGGFESELEKILNFGIDKQNLDAPPSFKVMVSEPGSKNQIQGSAIIKDGITEIVFDEARKKHNPTYLDLLAAIGSGDSKNLKLSVPLFDQKKLSRALLKSAYLLCFYWWGYEFAFSENARFIRDVIAGKKEYLCQVPLQWGKYHTGLQSGVSLLKIGKKRMAYVVNIILEGIEITTNANILIPIPSLDGLQNLAMIDQINKAKETTEITTITLPRLLVWNAYTISWCLVFPKATSEGACGSDGDCRNNG